MNRLKELRKERKMLQSDIAKILSVTPQSVSLYEVDKRDMSTEAILKLADFFNVSTDYLLGRSNVREEIKIPAESITVQNDFTDNEIAQKIIRVFLDEKQPISARRAEKIIDIAKSMIPDIANIYYIDEEKTNE